MSLISAISILISQDLQRQILEYSFSRFLCNSLITSDVSANSRVFEIRQIFVSTEEDCLCVTFVNVANVKRPFPAVFSYGRA